MVYKIIRHKYGVLVESFVIALVILVIGFSLGFYVESFRTKSLESDYKAYEVESLDLKLQNYYLQVMDSSACKSAIEQHFVFADKVYDKGLLLEKYEEANQITEDLALEKKNMSC